MYKLTKKEIGLIGAAMAITLVFLLGSAFGQVVKDGIYEDQVIVCINGNVIQESGNICKVFNVDDLTVLEMQEQIYNNPDSDTFDMEVLD